MNRSEPLAGPGAARRTNMGAGRRARVWAARALGALGLVAMGATGAPRLAASSAASSAQMVSVKPLVDSELAFCDAAATKGTRDAFMEFMADSGVFFRPGAVYARQVLKERPKQPGLLKWRPRVAGIAGSGEMGYTTGPWEARPTAKSPADSAGYGTYFTVWAVQKDGTWRAMLDIGVSGPRPAAPVESTTAPTGETAAVAGSPETASAAAAKCMEMEGEFSKACVASGASGAYASFLARDAVFLREELPPLSGPPGAHAAVTAKPGTWTWMPLRSHASGAGDLAYVYGNCTFHGNGWPADSLEYGNYARVWRGRSVVVDVVSPAPAPKRK
ncbi:MAG: hypothetical protein HZB25_02370 [Candidatus Eisenbacteria bacterium]|nr:hypothetical protein [Candidatus Eisenbacteria bacterium]